MPRIATVDVGTNTALLLVAEVREDGLEVVCERGEFVRLGEGVDRSGRIGPAAIARLVTALSTFREEAEMHGVEQFRVAATSASRDATNREEVAQVVREHTGLHLQVISGEEEAALSFFGAVSAFELTGRCAVLDIGGGSTELIVGDVAPGGGRTYVRSIDLGAVRLTERCFSSQPPSEEEIRAAAALVDEALEEADVPKEASQPLIGAAGTPTALAMVHHGLSLSATRTSLPTLEVGVIRDWCERLLALTYDEVLALHEEAMPGRADVFPAGVLLLHAFTRHLGAAEVLVSPRGLRHGLALSSEINQSRWNTR